MELAEIKDKLNLAIWDFLKRDKYLLEVDANERSITFKLASYMQNHFGDNYDVDCEYNKNLSDIKTIHVLKSELEKIYKFKNKNFKILKNEFTISVYPDIIVHKRNTNDNLLIVEVKKKPSNIYKIKYDFIKLKHYTKKTGKSGIGYEYGAFICFDTGQYPKIKWFQNGKKLK